MKPRLENILESYINRNAELLYQVAVLEDLLDQANSESADCQCAEPEQLDES